MTRPDFDQIIDRVGTRCSKWDDMQMTYGVAPSDGLAMWVADMDFRPPRAVQRAVQRAADHGIYGYPGRNAPYLEAIRWWHENRHGWQIETPWILTTAGLVNGVAMAIDATTEPGDGVIVMSPVYHAFARVIRASRRELVEFPLALREDLYRMDWDNWDSLLTGREKVLILCSPHNPGGRVWTRAELQSVADFARRHDLLLVSDEIHHDLVYPGHRHTPAALIDGIEDRLVMMSATTKTFNIAGSHLGNVIIADMDLRRRFADRMAAMGSSPNSFGLFMATAAYSPQGAQWVDALMHYLDGNRRVFDEGIADLPGVRSMPLEATYLAWVDFSGTGMTAAEFTGRVERHARIAASHGHTFGTGGETFLRFNLAMPRAQVVKAAERLREAFADLQ